MSTLTTPPPGTVSARDDVAHLHKALKGLRCKTSKVIDILAHRDSEQRDLIMQEYETAHSEPLTKRLGSELRGNLKRAVLLWLDEPAARDAAVARQALGSPLVDYQAITEVICSRSPSQLRRFKEVYLKQYHNHLERDIEDHLSGDLQKLLHEYISIPRYEGPEFDQEMVENDAKDLYKAGEKKKLGTDQKTFIRIFCDRSSTQLAAINEAYEKNYGHSLEKAIRKETRGYFESGLLAILRCANDPALYFAKILRKSMKGLGTDDSRLIRVIVTRTEIDMCQIKEAYYTKYGKTLTQAVRSDTSSHYRDFLLALLGSD